MDNSVTISKKYCNSSLSEHGLHSLTFYGLFIEDSFIFYSCYGIPSSQYTFEVAVVINDTVCTLSSLLDYVFCKFVHGLTHNSL